MKITQAYEFVNDATKEILGEQAIDVDAELGNIVDVGKAIENIYADGAGLDAYVKAIANRIGKMLFVSRAYRGALPKILKDSWEFGSIVGKIQAELMDAGENEAWELVQGASYDPYVVNLPVVDAKFFNKMATFEIDITLPRDQVKQSFISADEMMRFLAMLEVQVNNSMEVKIEALTRACIANMIGVTIDDGTATPRCVKLLSDYNTIAGTSLTAAQALINEGFLRYAAGVLILYKGYLAEYSTLYNIGGKARHTPNDLLHFVVNTEFAARMKTNLGSTTYHKDLVELPFYEEISSWQGTGMGGSFADRTTIAGKCVSDSETITVNQSGVIGVMFDNDALGILQPKRKTETIYNPKGEFYNNFHKWESRQFNDFNENCVVFLLA